MRLKKLASILLLLLLVMTSGGVLLLYKLQQLSIRTEMAATIESRADFIVLRLSSKEYQQCRINRHEISYQGKLYDVKSIKRIGSQVELHAIHDRKEEGIVKHIASLFRTSKNGSTPLPLELAKLFSLTYISPSTQNIRPPISNQSHEFFTSSDNVSNHSLEILSPPPQMS